MASSNEYGSSWKIDVFTNNKIVRDTIPKGKHRARLANHGHLWAEIFEQIDKNRREVNVYWMPSHTDTTQKERKGTSLDERMACKRK